MKNNRGKGYFYAKGQRDAALMSGIPYGSGKLWPRWASVAYVNGFNGWAL